MLRLATAGVHASDEHIVETHATPREALAYALGRAGQDDRIVVFGSFLTVADVLESRSRRG